ncbi:hypothetical protein OFM52_31890, partial [Escherichia coli]|nr:hypothetical protein [Escherichia coli]
MTNSASALTIMLGKQYKKHTNIVGGLVLVVPLGRCFVYCLDEGFGNADGSFYARTVVIVGAVVDW